MPKPTKCSIKEKSHKNVNPTKMVIMLSKSAKIVRKKISFTQKPVHLVHFQFVQFNILHLFSETQQCSCSFANDI